MDLNFIQIKEFHKFHKFFINYTLFATLAVLSFGIVKHCDGSSSDCSGLGGLYTCRWKLVATVLYCGCHMILGECRCLLCAGLTLSHASSQTAWSATVSYKMCRLLKHNLIIWCSLVSRAELSISGICCCLPVCHGSNQHYLHIEYFVSAIMVDDRLAYWFLIRKSLRFFVLVPIRFKQQLLLHRTLARLFSFHSTVVVLYLLSRFLKKLWAFFQKLWWHVFYVSIAHLQILKHWKNVCMVSSTLHRLLHTLKWS